MRRDAQPASAIEPAEASARRGAFAGLGALAITVSGILAAVFVNEGGYVNHPRDPGGATNHGVTERVARAAGYRGDMRHFPKYCRGPDDICAEKIYLERYIRAPGFLPVIEAEPAVGEELVDSAVNFGPARPSCWFQRTINELHPAMPLKVDCKVGPRTVTRYRQLQSNMGPAAACVRTLDRLDAKQRAEYDRLVRAEPATYRPFYKGWIAHRIGNVDRKACGKGIV